MTGTSYPRTVAPAARTPGLSLEREQVNGAHPSDTSARTALLCDSDALAKRLIPLPYVLALRATRSDPTSHCSP